MALRFGEVVLCSWCDGRGYKRRGTHHYECNVCKGRGYYNHTPVPYVAPLPYSECVCACMCNTLTSFVLCDVCLQSQNEHGVCQRISLT